MVYLEQEEKINMLQDAKTKRKPKALGENIRGRGQRVLLVFVSDGKKLLN